MHTSFPQAWQQLLSELNFTTQTDIQLNLFDPIRSGQSVLAVSPTGTGKTLAYLWPSLLRLTPKKSQQLLILAPNSELAGQIFEVTKTWAEPLGLTAQVLLSGSSQKRQVERLKKGPEILIGTAGRVFELIKLKKIKLMNVETIILDEFDQLLGDSQYGFVQKITNHVPREHQMIYVSATQAIEASNLAEGTVTVDLSDQTIETISHHYIMVDSRDRLNLLRKFANIPDMRGLVFFNSLSDLGACEERLNYLGCSAISLASDVNIKFRKLILERFKNQELALLLATDLVARGIDIEGLELVINYEVPRDAETYTHRAGRTGRMGKSGLVITLVSHKEDLKKLKKFAPVSEVMLKGQKLYTL